MVTDALDIVIAENCTKIDELLSIEKAKSIILAGGFGLCIYLREKLAEHYGKQGVEVIFCEEQTSGEYVATRGLHC